MSGVSNPRLNWLENQRGNLIIKIKGQQRALEQANRDVALAKSLAGRYADELKALDEEIARLQGVEGG